MIEKSLKVRIAEKSVTTAITGRMPGNVTWRKRAQTPAPSSGSAVPDAPGAPGGLGQALMALQAAATPVHGPWGSGRLLRTSLVSVLQTDGHILIGAVQPSVLYADAAQLSK